MQHTLIYWSREKERWIVQFFKSDTLAKEAAIEIIPKGDVYYVAPAGRPYEVG